MNYLLDTNIIIILFEGRNNEIRDNVKQILLDDENNFYVSTISLLEIAQLYRKKKFKNINYELLNTGDKLIKHILKTIDMVEILPFEERHAFATARLIFVPNHNDSNDLAIIAHSITENLILISSDDKFPYYEEQGALVIHNSR